MICRTVGCARRGRVGERFRALAGELNERQRRLWAASDRTSASACHQFVHRRCLTSVVGVSGAAATFTACGVDESVGLTMPALHVRPQLVLRLRS